MSQKPFKDVDGSLSNTGSTYNTRKIDSYWTWLPVVMVTIVSSVKGWWQKVRIAEKIGGEELKLARRRPAVPKAYVRALINLRKTFSLIYDEIGWGGGMKTNHGILRIFISCFGGLNPFLNKIIVMRDIIMFNHFLW